MQLVLGKMENERIYRKRVFAKSRIPSIVEEVMKRKTKLPYLFYTHPESYYEIPQDFIKFEVMLSIPKPSHVPLPPQEIAKLHDYKKKWLEAVRVSTVRSDTTKHKFSTLPIGLYESGPPPNVDFNFLSFFFGRDATTQATKEKVIFYRKCSLSQMKTFMTPPVKYPQRSSRKTRRTAYSSIGTETFNLECYTATSIPAVSMAERESFPDGIRLSEGKFEELISATRT